MPQNPTQLNATTPIAEQNGEASQAMRDWAYRVSKEVTIVNSGSPEGVVTAPQYSLYVDEAVPLSPVTYRKMLPDIGGDRSKGWAAV